MKTLFEILFFKNYSQYVWNLLAVLFVSEIYIIRKNVFSVKNTRLIIIGVSVFIGIALVLRSSTINTEETYSSPAIPHTSACLIENYSEFAKSDDIYQNTPRYLHYFEDKTLTIAKCVDNKDEIIAYFSHYCPKLIVTVDDEDMEKISETDFEKIRSNTLYLKKDGRLYILDKTWSDSANIVCVQSGQQVFFLSEQLLQDINSGTYSKDYLDSRDLDLDELTYMNHCRGERDVNQVIFLFVLYLIGWAIMSLIFGGNEKRVLAAFFGLPFAVSLVNAISVIYIIIGIPLRKIVLLTTLILILSAIVFVWKKRGLLLSLKDIICSTAIPFAVISFMVYMKLYIFVGDSLSKTMTGIRMAEYSLSREEILGYVDSGLLEPIMHCWGWKFHIDFVYGIYSLIPICIIGILVSALYYLSKNSKVTILIIIAGVLFLLSNDDFMSIGFFVHINSIVACIILMIVVTLVLMHDEKVSSTLVLATLSLGLITARLEGPVYICIIFALLSGVKAFREKYFLINLVVGAEIIIWELTLLIGVNLGKVKEAAAWNTEEAVVVMVGAFAIMVLPFILRMKRKLIEFVVQHYYIISTMIFIIAAIVILFLGPEISLKTAKIFAKHFATSYESNSGGIWSYSLLMMPLLLQDKRKTTGFLVSLIVCYIFSLYILFSFRTGYPIHWDHNDSCRRMLMQIMPTTMFAIGYIVGNNNFEQTE